MFNVIEKERAWRKENGLPEGFETLKSCKPIVAVGAKEPLGGQTMMADYFHGIDGLGNVHETHPHHTSDPSLWTHLFDAPPPSTLLSTTATTTAQYITLFTPTTTPSHLALLSLLTTHPPNTLTLLAIGPLTNFALAAAHSASVFLRAKEVIVMGGAIAVVCNTHQNDRIITLMEYCQPGNITPVAEFNCIADPIAAARVYALTGKDPRWTVPPESVGRRAELGEYPSGRELGEGRLRVTIFPLDITTPHTISKSGLEQKTKALVEKGSPLAEWVSAFLSATFKRSESLYQAGEADDVKVCFHDPVCVWYILDKAAHPEMWENKEGEDIRVETLGQWTRGMCVVDRRGMRMGDGDEAEGGEEEGKANDGGWLSREMGNRVGRCIRTPGFDHFEPVLLNTIFGG